MPKEKLTWMSLAMVACAALGLGNCTARKGPDIPDGTPVPHAIGRVVNLDQGWSEADQEWFWFTSQGSRLVPYDWFLALEQATSTEPFRSNANMEEYRYLTAKPSRLNPDGLPVGFTRDVDGETRQAWMGWTCAACHTNQVEYKGTALRIDGAPMMADGMGFLNDLLESMRRTVDDDAKFERFARQVLKGRYDAAGANGLRRELFERTEWLSRRMGADNPRYPAGYARLDAFGSIFNQVLGTDLDLPANYKPANAPVSIPFLWDTPHCDLVQWNGNAPNAGIGPLARNVGEVLGVFATVTVDPKGKPPGYKSSARIIELGQLEKKLESLWSPLWPMEYLPAIDPVRAERGQALYQQNCASCHAVIDRTDPKRQISVVMTPLPAIGTDKMMATNIATRTALTGRLEGTPAGIVGGEPFPAEAPGGAVLGNVVIGTILRHPVDSLEAGLKEYERVRKTGTPKQPSYKARPLNGIWATAPYLHNGSVPNLWQLLQPADQRVKKFYVGSREFDPVNVGFDTRPFRGGFELDTTLEGNFNSGHTYGTQLSDTEKWELIEYMKSL